MSNRTRRAIGTVLLWATVVLIAASGFIFMSIDEADANGAPVKVILTYVKGISNYGSTSATGVAEVVMKEGEVSISVVGLAPLADETYVGWLVNTTSGEAMSVGRFNSDASEVVKTRLVLPAEIPDKQWNLVMVTIEPKSSALVAPGERHSISGYFPDSAEASRAPAQLPNTGGDTGQTGTAQRPPSQPAPVAVATAAPAPAPASSRIPFGDSERSILAAGVVALAIVGLGAYTRAKKSR